MFPFSLIFMSTFLMLPFYGLQNRLQSFLESPKSCIVQFKLIRFTSFGLISFVVNCILRDIVFQRVCMFHLPIITLIAFILYTFMQYLLMSINVAFPICLIVALSTYLTRDTQISYSHFETAEYLIFEFQVI